MCLHLFLNNFKFIWPLLPTARKIELPKALLVTVSILLPFFFDWKVIKTQSAYSSLGSLCLHSVSSLKKRMVLNFNTSVHLFSNCRTFTYSQEWHAKKKDTLASWINTFSTSVVCCFAISLRTQIGRTFCWTGLGSSFLKAQNWQDKSWINLPTLSWVRFGLLCSRKVYAMNEMVFWIVLSAMESWIDPKNLPNTRAMAKALRSHFCSLLSNPLRRTLLTILMDLQ